MSTPKEPCFFSDDPVYARGPEWYRSLFAGAAPCELRGESSTHYTKLPTYPRTVERMAAMLPQVRLIYVMREPTSRLVSQYVHEWSVRNVSCPIDRAVDEFPPLVEYGRYAMQLEPYVAAFGPERVLPVFYERLAAAPQGELERIARFIGLEGAVRWDQSLGRRNASEQRLRESPVRDAVMNAPVLRGIRRSIVPKAWRERVKKLWTLREPPRLSPAARDRLSAVYDADLVHLGDWLGVNLTCATFRETVLTQRLEWAGVRA